MRQEKEADLRSPSSQEFQHIGKPMCTMIARRLPQLTQSKPCASSIFSIIMDLSPPGYISTEMRCATKSNVIRSGPRRKEGALLPADDIC